MKPADLIVDAGAVTVTAPARLHLGFIDPAATLGRRFGSLGLAIDAPCTRLSVRRAERDRFHAGGGEGELELARVRDHLATLRRHFGRPAPLSVCLHETLPTHAGFGSGTQLALALGRAFAAVHGIEVTSAELAALLGRGARSGIGIAAFDAGGLVLDAGPGRRGPAPVLARVPFPPCWRVLLVIEPQMRGRHGADEAHALAALPPLPQAAAAGLAHLTLMGILPAALEADFRAFARGVSEMQRVLGAYFAPAQGGNAYTSPAVARLLQWIGANFEAGVGQSSWGPTGFAIFESPPAARRAVDDARRAGVAAPHLDLRIVGGRNCGAALDFPE